MFEIGTALFYVNFSPYFQQWGLNQDLTFPNLSVDSKLGFLKVSLRLNFQVFPNSQRDSGIFEGCSDWSSQFFAIQERKDGNIYIFST